MAGGVPPAIGIAASTLLIAAGMHMLHSRRAAPTIGYTRPTVAFCLAASAFLCGLTWEWPGGLAVWLGMAGLAGLLTAFRHPSRPDPKKARRRDRPGARETLRAFSPLAALSGVLLGGGAAAAVALAAAAWLPVALLERAFLAIVLWPVLWSAVLLWLYATEHPLRAALGAGFVAVAAGLAVWLAVQSGAQAGVPHAS